MRKVRVGVFGGYRGARMVEQLLDHPHAEVVAVCDQYSEVLEKVRGTAEKAGVQVALYASFDDFIKHDMDAVVLANYANEHAIYAVRCLRAGKHVMSEVLPAETPAQLVELIETVEETGLVYTYAENYCYMTAPFEMWKRYRRGDIGTVMYAEGEYVHDCASIWPDITYGDKDHWRNRAFATFYCTHSCGPLITITGQRPVRVTGFETNLNTEEKQMRIGLASRAALEMITLENGAVVKSLHGHLKREPGSVNYQVYGTKGMMESKRYNDEEFNIYTEGQYFCKGDWEKYEPHNDVGSWVEKRSTGHGGSDFYTVHCFIEKILGNPDGEWAIDVYTAADMGLCGLMAWRSVMAGGTPMEIPDLRKADIRDMFRNDNTGFAVANEGEELLPRSSQPDPEVPDEVYDAVRKQWLRQDDSPVKDLFAPKE